MIDFPNDPGCTHPDDDDEFNVPPPPPPPVPQCRDGKDNDGDGFIDFPADPGCSHPDDNDEFNVLIPPPPTAGCVEVLIEGFGPGNNPLPVLPGFTVTLDGSQTLTTNANGRATFNGVSTGSHTVFQGALSGWTSLSVTPVNGQVIVTSGYCVGVVFKNRQELPLPNPIVPILPMPVFLAHTPILSAEEQLCQRLEDQYGSLSSTLKKLRKKSKKKTNLVKFLEFCKDHYAL